MDGRRLSRAHHAAAAAAIRMLEEVVDDVEACRAVADKDAEVEPRHQKRRCARVLVVDTLDVSGKVIP